jgi:hypothetical protein
VFPAWRHFDTIAILNMDEQSRKNWKKEMKEHAEKEARENKGLSQMLGTKPNNSDSPSSAPGQDPHETTGASHLDKPGTGLPDTEYLLNQ